MNTATTYKLLTQNDVEVADMPVVHLVYDVDVTAGAKGKVEFTGGKYYLGDGADIMGYWQAQGLTMMQAVAKIGEGKNVLDKAGYDNTGTNAITSTNTATTSQWGAGEDLTFTVKPDAGYVVDTATSSLGTLKDNGDGTYTLNVPESAITSASAKAAVSFTFKEGAKVEYKVEHYVQNVDGSTYPTTATYTETKSDVAIGDKATATPITTGTYGGVDFTGVTFDSTNTNNVKDGNVPATGTLTLKLYYKRNFPVTVTFVPNDTTATVTPTTANGVFGAALTLPTPTNTNPKHVFQGWFTEITGGTQITAPATFPTTNTSYYAHWDTGADPIRPYDPADPTNKNPSKTDPDYLLPNTNGKDENGSGDDKIVTPNPATDSAVKPTVTTDGNLELPDGGTDNKGTTYPPSVIDSEGNVVAYLFYVKYQDTTNSKDITTEAVAAGGVTKYTVPKATANTTVAHPTITGYTYHDTTPSETIATTTLAAATAKFVVTVNYTETKGTDPIRPYDPADPGNKNPSKPNPDYLLPNTNGKDENGGGDDKIVTPNPATDPTEQPSTNTDGNLELPDGGSIKNPDGTTKPVPPAIINPEGDVVSYLFYAKYQDTTNNKDITSAGAAAGGQTKFVVAKTTTSTKVPSVTISGYTYVNTTPSDTVLTSALENATAKTTVTLNYTKNPGNDPIRPYDPTDPGNKNPTKPNPDYLIPGTNGTDENGGGDDKIITPKPTTDPTEQPGTNTDGNLELPDGGTDNKNTTYPPSVIDPNGNTVAYIYYIRLLVKGTTTELAAPAGYATKVVVPASATADQVVTPPVISGYTYDSADPTDRKVTIATLKGATAKTEVKLYYTETKGTDPIRPYDPADPGNKNPTKPNPDYLLPNTNGKDENGGGDDKIVTPNPATDPTEQPSTNTDGNLELPDGGSIKNPDGTTKPVPPAIINPEGDVVSYLFYVKYQDTTNNKDITTAGVAAGGQSKYIVAKTSTSTKVPSVNISGYTYVNTTPSDTVQTSALAGASAKTVVTLNYTKNPGSDPIRPYDPADPGNKNPTKPNPDYLIPGTNGTDENGGGDDKIITPKPTTDPTEKPGPNTDGNLELPDGGTDNKNTTYPPSVIDPNGNTVSYIYYIRLLVKGTTTELTAPAGYATKVLVPASATANQVVIAPVISGYTYDSADPTDRTVTMATLKGATAKTEVKLYYTKNPGNDPIRPYDKEDPTNTNPSTADQDGWLLPGDNKTDDAGQADDKIVTPNDPTDPKDVPEVNDAGNLELPDGGTIKNPDGTETKVGPSVVDPQGKVVSYIVYVELKDKATDNELTASGSFESKQYVAVGRDFNTYAPAIDGYKYVDSDPTLPIPAATVAGFMTKADATVTLYYDRVSATGDPVRPYNPTDPDKNNPADPNKKPYDPSTGDTGFLVPGDNQTDESGATGSDDEILIPNDTSDPKDPAKVTDNGNAYLPDGGYIDTNKDGKQDAGDTVVPPCVMDNKGDIIAYLLFVDLVDEDTNKALTPSNMAKPLVYMVDVNTACVLTVPAVSEVGYSYSKATLGGNALSSLTISYNTLEKGTDKDSATVVMYYNKTAVEQVTVTIILEGPAGDTAFTAAKPSNFIVDTTATLPTVKGSQFATKGQATSINAPAVSGYTATPSSVSLTAAQMATDQTVKFTYTPNPSGGGGGGGGTTTYYSLSFQTNGGTTIDPVSKVSGSTVSLDSYKPTKPGNTFLGWFSTAEDATKAVSDSTVKPITSVKLTKNTTVYAGWNGLTEDHIAYLVGYQDKTFRPTNNMTRAEAAMMFYRLLSDKTMGSRMSFSDVPADAWYTQAVQVLASKGIINGYTNGTFKPSKGITRAEFAAIASRFENLTSSDKSFSDVPTSFWAYRYINSAATKGWITGYADGTFKPSQNITRAEVVTLVNRVLLRTADQKYIGEHMSEMKTFSDVPTSYFAYWDVLEAANAHDYTKDTSTGAETAWTALTK